MGPGSPNYGPLPAMAAGHPVFLTVSTQSQNVDEAALLEPCLALPSHAVSVASHRSESPALLFGQAASYTISQCTDLVRLTRLESQIHYEIIIAITAKKAIKGYVLI